MELSWKLRPASSADKDKFVDHCQPDSENAGWGPVKQIRLHWLAGGGERSHAWNCEDNHGTTGFELAEGTAQLWVTPECSDGVPAAPDTYIAPATVERDVIRGDVVSLGAVELVVSVFHCATACTCDSNFGSQLCICGTPPDPEQCRQQCQP